MSHYQYDDDPTGFPEKKPKFVCQICPEVYYSQVDLDSHMNTSNHDVNPPQLLFRGSLLHNNEVNRIPKHDSVDFWELRATTSIQIVDKSGQEVAFYDENPSQVFTFLADPTVDHFVISLKGEKTSQNVEILFFDTNVDPSKLIAIEDAFFKIFRDQMSFGKNEIQAFKDRVRSLIENSEELTKFAQGLDAYLEGLLQENELSHQESTRNFTRSLNYLKLSEISSDLRMNLLGILYFQNYEFTKVENLLNLHQGVLSTSRILREIIFNHTLTTTENNYAENWISLDYASQRMNFTMMEIKRYFQSKDLTKLKDNFLEFHSNDSQLNSLGIFVAQVMLDNGEFHGAYEIASRINKSALIANLGFEVVNLWFNKIMQSNEAKNG